MKGKIKEALDFYYTAYDKVQKQGFSDEIEWCRNRSFDKITKREFIVEYVFAVLASSGLREQIVRKNFDNFVDTYRNGENAFDTVKNKRQKDAIMTVFLKRDKIFETLQSRKTDFGKIEYLDSLPQMGPKTKYHLARNIGIDCVKPDRHLLKLATMFEYADPDDMCRDIQRNLRPPERLGVIDVVLWRYCNLRGI